MEKNVSVVSRSDLLNRSSSSGSVFRRVWTAAAAVSVVFVVGLPLSRRWFDVNLRHVWRSRSPACSGSAFFRDCSRITGGFRQGESSKQGQSGEPAGDAGSDRRRRISEALQQLTPEQRLLQGETRASPSEPALVPRKPPSEQPFQRLDEGLDGTASSTSPTGVTFLQGPDEFGVPGKGISLDALGEPKSGTTWLGRVILALALELCGSRNNTWRLTRFEFDLASCCRLSIGRPNPARPFTARLLCPHDESANQGVRKHIIPGMDTKDEHDTCHNGGIAHRGSFEDNPPCRSLEPPTRERLDGCLWNTSSSCLAHVASVDPAVRRSIVIFRDPRNVIISAYKMRTEEDIRAKISGLSLEEYIRRDFERWMWHTSAVFAPSSHVVYYKELEESHLGLMGIATFMGLQCSEEQAFKVWQSRRKGTRSSDYTNHGLPEQTVEWMTDIMAKLLPPLLALRWGAILTDDPPRD